MIEISKKPDVSYNKDISYMIIVNPSTILTLN